MARFRVVGLFQAIQSSLGYVNTSKIERKMIMVDEEEKSIRELTFHKLYPGIPPDSKWLANVTS